MLVEWGIRAVTRAFLLRAGPSWTLGDLIDGDLSLLVSRGEGPAPPTGPEVVAVVGLSLQACGKMTDHHKELRAQVSFIEFFLCFN